MLPRDLLNHTEYPETLRRIFDLGDRALQTWETVYSDFLPPPEIAAVVSLFSKLTELHCVAWGGYPQAERQRLAISRAELPLAPEQVELALLEISGNFLFDTATHRDFLGSLLGTGLERPKVGDIVLLGERGAQAIVVPELVEYLTLHLTQVRTVPVKTRLIDFSELKVRPPQQKELASVEASLRLDAVASAGFSMSRSKMVDLINGDDVKVNWKSITQPSYTVKSGDAITVRGKGRLVIGEIVVTKKERYRVQMTRFV
jgi:photosystem II S4 domain protein